MIESNLTLEVDWIKILFLILRILANLFAWSDKSYIGILVPQIRVSVWRKRKKEMSNNLVKYSEALSTNNGLYI